MLGFKLEYFVSRFEMNLIYLQLWVPLKIVVLGGAQIDNFWWGSKLNTPIQFEKNPMTGDYCLLFLQKVKLSKGQQRKKHMTILTQT